MLKPDDTNDEQQQKVPSETEIEIERDGVEHDHHSETGPQSPPMVSSSPVTTAKRSGGRKLQFNMSTKIQVIPNNRQGQLNTTFLATVPGILKLAEIALSFICFILAICADRNSTPSAWTEHIAFETCIVVCALLAGYVIFPHLTIKDEATREGLIVLELIFYGINTLLYFISIWLMVQLSATWISHGRGAAIFAAILCAALTIIYAVETFFKWQAWRGENAPTSRIITGPPTVAGQHYDTNAELRREPGPEMA
ncbi:hypothetical protein AB6A40_005997 [Gnathostoma spinigerum]|uniref:MARVEL domain-containing protein n=1 Tax=Gnathostoma spinigerum TaxID=75299 RepID=A0ABD6EQK3_9BILA